MGSVRTLFLASVMCIWQYRSVLLIPGLVIVALDYATLQPELSAITPVLQLLSLAMLISVVIMMHRLILLGDSTLNLGWGKREIKYILILLAMLAMGLFVFAVLQHLMLNILTMIFLPKEFPPPTSLNVDDYQASQALKERFTHLLIGSSVLGLAGLSAVFSRFSTLLPFTAIDKDLDLGRAWFKGKKKQFTIFWLVYLSIVLFLPLGAYANHQLLAPVILLLAFVLQVFIFTTLTVACHLIEDDPDSDYQQ